MDGKWLMMKIHFFHVANQFAPLVVSMASVQPLMFVPVRLDGEFLIEIPFLFRRLFSLQIILVYSYYLGTGQTALNV